MASLKKLMPTKLMPFGIALILLALFVPTMAGAQDTAEDKQDETTETEEPADEIEDIIVVTASKTEQRIHEVPSAFSVITAEELETLPMDDFGDVLRNVPGLSVSQMSARDVQVNSRQATSSLSTGQLVMLDGRTIYLDFFGFVMWDFLPVNQREIKQVEVVRGPGSAVWGANAMTGVINVITKSPSEMVGTDLILGVGDFDTLYGSLTHAGAKEKLGYKISVGYYEQEPFDRPTGIIPGSEERNPPFGTPYPDFENSGTEQPKVDFRLDYDSSDSTTWSFSAGFAATDGIMHSGIGPFDIDSDSALSYFKGSWNRQAMQLTFFANILDGEAANLLTRDLTGAPILLTFQSDTFNLDFSDTRVAGQNHILTYGARARSNSFDLSIAPQSDDRDEIGVFLQDEILIGDKVRWLVGGRVDNIDPVDTVFSPRTSLMFSPTSNHTFRVSYNQAYRAPSVIENFLNVTIVNQVLLPLPPELGGPTPFIFPSLAIGNPELEKEELTAFEVGYVGTFGRSTLSVSAYRSELEGSTDFFTAATYDAANPPPGWPLPPQFLAAPPPFGFAGLFPSLFSYRNIGEIENQGVEIAWNARPSNAWSYFINYTFQDDPEATGIPREEINTPPEHRVNLGAAYNGDRFFANGNVNYSDDAFWTDVLDSRFAGPTDSFTQFNLTLGYHLVPDRIVLSIVGNNIFDEDVQQHVFGDLIERKLSAQLRFSF